MSYTGAGVRSGAAPRAKLELPLGASALCTPRDAQALGDCRRLQALLPEGDEFLLGGGAMDPLLTRPQQRGNANGEPHRQLG